MSVPYSLLPRRHYIEFVVPTCFLDRFNGLIVLSACTYIRWLKINTMKVWGNARLTCFESSVAGFFSSQPYNINPWYRFVQFPMDECNLPCKPLYYFTVPELWISAIIIFPSTIVFQMFVLGEKEVSIKSELSCDRTNAALPIRRTGGKKTTQRQYHKHTNKYPFAQHSLESLIKPGCLNNALQ